MYLRPSKIAYVLIYLAKEVFPMGEQPLSLQGSRQKNRGSPIKENPRSRSLSNYLDLTSKSIHLLFLLCLQLAFHKSRAFLNLRVLGINQYHCWNQDSLYALAIVLSFHRNDRY